MIILYNQGCLYKDRDAYICVLNSTVVTYYGAPIDIEETLTAEFVASSFVQG